MATCTQPFFNLLPASSSAVTISSFLFTLLLSLMNIMKKLALFVVVLAIVLKPVLHLSFSFSSSSSSSSSTISQQQQQEQSDLQYDFYREICPQAEQLVRYSVKQLYSLNPNTLPQLLRLLFHDCFVQGCDASILLEESLDGSKPEKIAIPNETLKGFDKVEIIKSNVEQSCPGIVSCADILVLATREAILLAGGPFYPVFTGRKDSIRSYYEIAGREIPSPDNNISSTLSLFKSKGFNKRETVSLLGAHNVGAIDCQFIRERVFNFSGTGQPDPTLPTDFLRQLRGACNGSSSNNASSSCNQPLWPSIPSGKNFDAHYYRRLLRGRGLLFSDQQLMAEESTARLVEAYASDNGVAFRRDFAKAMMKLSSLKGNDSNRGLVRLSCYKLN